LDGIFAVKRKINHKVITAAAVSFAFADYSTIAHFK
jgi:hypothetical protein